MLGLEGRGVMRWRIEGEVMEGVMEVRTGRGGWLEEGLQDMKNMT